MEDIRENPSEESLMKVGIPNIVALNGELSACDLSIRPMTIVVFLGDFRSA